MEKLIMNLNDKSLKVLVVDDMLVMRKILSKMLFNKGIEDITEADNGKQAWKLLLKAYEENTPFDLITADWNMPFMKGIDLLKKCEVHEYYNSTPFLMITSEVSPCSMNQLTERQSEHVYLLAKPFTEEQFSSQIDTIFS
jgi:two-component system chemotaxis response regulator CheY